MEPHGAQSCQHSKPPLQTPASMLLQAPAPSGEHANFPAFFSYPFHGKLLLSRISPHKPLNTSPSTVNGLQQREGSIYNDPGLVCTVTGFTVADTIIHEENKMQCLFSKLRLILLLEIWLRWCFLLQV